MYKKRLQLLIACLLLATTSLMSQTTYGTMKGKLFDRDTNEELTGASIYIKALDKGCITDNKGEFIIENLPEGKHTIHISFLGYKDATRVIDVSATNAKTIRIELEMKQNALDEVTITAKSEVRKLKDQGMPVTIISMSSMQGTVTSVSDILAKTVGLTVRSSGGVGSTSRISVRGLEGKRIGFFIDEVPMNDQSDFIDLNDIPVDMIERIEIYKGVVPSRFGGSSIGGAVNLVLKEYPERYLDVSYMLESFNTNKVQMVAKRNLTDKGIVFGLGGGYTHADNDYEMESPYIEGLKIKRNHDRFKKTMIGGSLKAKRWWFDEVEFEPVFIDTRKQIQGVETDIRKAETNSKAFLLANSLEKHDFLLPGLDFDLSSAIAYTIVNLIDTAKVRYDWYGNSYPTPSKYGGELGNQYAANSDDKKFTFLTKLNLEYIIDRSHSINFNSVFNLANGYPKDSLRDLSLNRKSVFDSKMRSWVGGLNHDFRTSDDKFMNSFTARYYQYTMKTRKSPIYGGDNVKDIDLNKKDFGISNSLRYRFTRTLMAKLSAAYDVRIPSEQELLGDGYAVSPSEVLEPERNTNVNAGLLFDRMGVARDNLQVELSFYYMYLRNMIRYTKGFIDAQYQNFGKMRTLGVELDVKMDILPVLYGYCNITYQDLRDVRETEEGSQLPNPTKGKRMPNIPYLMGNAGLEFHKANLFGGKGQNTRVFADASYIEEYFYDFEMTAASQRRIPDSLTFDLGVEHSFLNNSLYLSARLKNLTDERVLSEFNRPLPGRSVGVKVRYIFK